MGLAFFANPTPMHLCIHRKITGKQGSVNPSHHPRRMALVRSTGKNLRPGLDTEQWQIASSSFAGHHQQKIPLLPESQLLCMYGMELLGGDGAPPRGS